MSFCMLLDMQHKIGIMVTDFACVPLGRHLLFKLLQILLVIEKAKILTFYKALKLKAGFDTSYLHI